MRRWFAGLATVAMGACANAGVAYIPPSSAPEVVDIGQDVGPTRLPDASAATSDAAGALPDGSMDGTSGDAVLGVPACEAAEMLPSTVESFERQVVHCTTSWAIESAAGACVSDCLQLNTGIAPACGACFAALHDCTAIACASSCDLISEASVVSAGCIACRCAGCGPALEACAGIDLTERCG